MDNTPPTVHSNNSYQGPPSSPVIDFLTFRKMITPIIIQIVFWLGVVLVIIAGLINIVQGSTHRYGSGEQVLLGVLMMLLGPLVVRIYCEILILFFRMNSTLTDIRKNTMK